MTDKCQTLEQTSLPYRYSRESEQTVDQVSLVVRTNIDAATTKGVSGKGFVQVESWLEFS